MATLKKIFNYIENKIVRTIIRTVVSATSFLLAKSIRIIWIHACAVGSTFICFLNSKPTAKVKELIVKVGTGS